MELTLNPEESELLVEILQERQKAFLLEISHSDDNAFRQILRRRESVLEILLDKLKLRAAA